MNKKIKNDIFSYKLKWFSFLGGIFVLMILLGIYDFNYSTIFYLEKETDEYYDFKNFKTVSGKMILNGYLTPFYGNIERFFSDTPNQLQYKGHYHNGLPEGNWSKWYENGNKKEERTSDYHKKWYESGIIRLEGEFIKGMRYGNWSEWYESGIIRLEGEFIKGMRYGNWSEWYENGKKKKSTYYINDNVITTNETPLMEWYENGNKKEERTYDYHKKWYESGIKKFEKIELSPCDNMTTISYNKNGSIINKTVSDKKNLKLEAYEFAIKVLKPEGDYIDLMSAGQNGCTYHFSGSMYLKRLGNSALPRSFFVSVFYNNSKWSLSKINFN